MTVGVMTVGVVIIVAGRHDHLRRTVCGLSRSAERPDEVVIVNMGADPLPVGTGDLAVRVINHTAPDGPLPLGAARNAGAQATSCDHLIFLDVDCLPDPLLVGRYRRVLTAQSAGVVCGPVRYLRQNWLEDTKAAVGCVDSLVTRSDAPPARPQPEPCRPVVDQRHELFWSLAFGITRRTWDLIGGFDERYVGYGAEDTDFGFRARQAGADMVWFGGAGIAFHQWHAPTRLDPNRTAEIVGNALRFHKRWGRWPMTGWLLELQQLGRVEFNPGANILRLRHQP